MGSAYAKDFNRPEWKRLVNAIRRNKNRPPEKILSAGKEHIDERKILCCNKDNWLPSEKSDIFQSYRNQDIAGKRQIISLFGPNSIDPSGKNPEPFCV